MLIHDASVRQTLGRVNNSEGPGSASQQGTASLPPDALPFLPSIRNHPVVVYTAVFFLQVDMESNCAIEYSRIRAETVVILYCFSVGYG
jgi:hypothetical protein